MSCYPLKASGSFCFMWDLEVPAWQSGGCTVCSLLLSTTAHPLIPFNFLPDLINQRTERQILGGCKWTWHGQWKRKRGCDTEKIRMRLRHKKIDFCFFIVHVFFSPCCPGPDAPCLSAWHMLHKHVMKKTPTSQAMMGFPQSSMIF